MNSKTCRDRGQPKPLTDFSPSTKNRDGRVSYCRPCLAIRHRSYRDLRVGSEPSRRSRARATSSDVTWCPHCRAGLPKAAFGGNASSKDGLTAYCKPCHNIVARANRLLRHGSTRTLHLERRHGITSEQFDAMAAAQGGLCLLCRVRPPKHVDHDHLTGKLRGLLCSGCHQGLGNVKDDAARLRAAADHVERHTWQRVLEAPGVYRLIPPREHADT